MLALCYLAGLLARASGGGVVRLPDKVSFLPEMLFGALFGAAMYYSGHGIWYALAAGFWSYAWMESGHGTALHMGKLPGTALSGRKQFLSPVVDWLCSVTHQPLGGSFYCWTLFALKGALIGLPVAPYGLALAFLWPLSYQVGQWIAAYHRTFGNACKEFLSGVCAGFVIFLYMC